MNTLTLFKDFVLGTLLVVFGLVGLYGTAYILASIACYYTVGCH